MSRDRGLRNESRRRLVQGATLGALLPVLGIHANVAQAATSGRALLVGNTAYKPSDENIPPARKCVTDLEVFLRRFGFSVTTLFEPKLTELRDELDKLKAAISADPKLPALFYFVGHGFQSNAENLLVPAGGNLDAKPEDLARASLSLEKDVFSRLVRPFGPAATVILVDTCRTPDRPLKPPEGLNQTLPPEGCHVAFATGPGKRAFAPQDPNKYTMFAEMLVAEMRTARPDTSVSSSLERVRSRVTRHVNSIDVIVKLFGRDAQSPELASNVSGDPTWIGGAPMPVLYAQPNPPPWRSVAGGGAGRRADRCGEGEALGAGRRRAGCDRCTDITGGRTPTVEGARRYLARR